MTKIFKKILNCTNMYITNAIRLGKIFETVALKLTIMNGKLKQ